MHKHIWGIVCAAMLVSGTAYAENSCPDGMREFVNSETQERVCIPATVQATPVAATVQTTPVAATGASDSASDNSYNDKIADDEPSAEEKTQEAAVSSENKANVNLDDVLLENWQSKLSEAEQTATVSTSQQRRQEIHENFLKSGLEFEFGVGYGFLANIDIHALFGYHFYSGDSVASFGIYLDANIKPGGEPIFGMDLTLDPTLQVSKGRFRFSMGMGFGIFISGEKDWYDNIGTVSFEFKPRLSFDWLMTKQVYFGGAIDIPVVISDAFQRYVAPMVNIDLHIGFRI